MIEAYIDRTGKLCLKPLTPDAEEDLREWVEKFRRSPHEYVDVETEMPEQEYQNYKRNMQRYGYDKQRGQQFGFQPQGHYMPQPPDFSPQASWPLWPLVLPYFLEGRRDGGEYGRDSGGSGGSEGSQGGNIGNNDRIIRSERGEYDGRGRGNENPRDTGRGDSPRR